MTIKEYDHFGCKYRPSAPASSSRERCPRAEG
jgi:hypothetical protein